MRGLGWRAGLLGRLYSLLHRLNLPFLGAGALCGCLEAFLSILRLPPEYLDEGPAGVYISTRCLQLRSVPPVCSNHDSHPRSRPCSWTVLLHAGRGLTLRRFAASACFFSSRSRSAAATDSRLLTSASCASQGAASFLSALSWTRYPSISPFTPSCSRARSCSTAETLATARSLHKLLSRGSQVTQPVGLLINGPLHVRSIPHAPSRTSIILCE